MLRHHSVLERVGSAHSGYWCYGNRPQWSLACAKLAKPRRRRHGQLLLARVAPRARLQHHPGRPDLSRERLARCRRALLRPGQLRAGRPALRHPGGCELRVLAVVRRVHAVGAVSAQLPGCYMAGDGWWRSRVARMRLWGACSCCRLATAFKVSGSRVAPQAALGRESAWQARGGSYCSSTTRVPSSGSRKPCAPSAFLRSRGREPASGLASGLCPLLYSTVTSRL